MKCQSCRDGEIYDVDAEFKVVFRDERGRQKTWNVCDGHAEILHQDYEIISCRKI